MYFPAQTLEPHSVQIKDMKRIWVLGENSCGLGVDGQKIFRYNPIRDTTFVSLRWKIIKGVIILGLATFGAIHCASWNVTLPSKL